MARRAHLLEAVTTERYPTQVGALCADGTWTRTPGRPDHETLALDHWALCGCSGAGGVYGPDRALSGGVPTALWRAVGTRLRRSGPLTLFVEQAQRTLTVCGWWEVMPTGKVRTLVTAGEVLCIEWRPPGVSHWLTILGAGNHGLEPCPSSGTAQERAAALCLTVRRMIDLLRTEGLGSLQRTAGSQALHSFRRRHLTHFVLCHDNPAALALEAESYYGGHCECFRLGALVGPVYHLDVTGAYPSLCATERVPVRLLGYERGCPESVCEDLVHTYTCTAEVELETELPHYPYRDRRAGLTVWPVGRFVTTLAYPELLWAVRAGSVRRWAAIAWYESAPALQAWASHVLRLRAQFGPGNVLRDWTKALGNCLVGKLGQRDRQWVDRSSNRAVSDWAEWSERNQTGGWDRWRTLGGHTQREEVGDFAYNSCPQVAAHITSAMRVRLLEMIAIAGPQRVWYCDTDSVMTDETGYRLLRDAGWIQPHTPGSLGVKRVSDDVRLYGVKHYVEDGAVTLAGVSLLPGTVDRRGGVVWRQGNLASCGRAGHGPLPERVGEDVGTIALTDGVARLYRHGDATLDGTVHPFRYWED